MQKTRIIRLIFLPMVILLIGSIFYFKQSNFEADDDFAEGVVSVEALEIAHPSVYYEVKRQFGGVLYRLDFDSNTISGSVIYLREFMDEIDSLPLKGEISETTVSWTSYRNGYERFFSQGQIYESNDIQISRYLPSDSVAIESMRLIPIDFKTYSHKIESALSSPELLVLHKETVIGTYLFQLKVTDWNPKTHFGKTTLKVINNKDKKEVQTIQSDRFWFDKHLNFDNETDYNFDNIPDLTFSNGYNGSYGTATRDYYIFNEEKGEFVYNEQLTDIGAGTGIEIDPIQKRIVSYNKSGCCMHYQQAYVAKKDTFIMTKSLFVEDDGKVIVEERVNGKLEQTEKAYSEYTAKEINQLYLNF